MAHETICRCRVSIILAFHGEIRRLDARSIEGMIFVNCETGDEIL
jgi:hypothetical protein